MKGKFLVVLVTAPKENSREIARKILEKGLAACVNMYSVKSLYWWKGKIEENSEDLLIIKTTEDAYKRLEEFIREIHPYEVPEIIALEIVRGLDKYLEWVEEETKFASE